MTSAPACANNFTAAAPMPREPPVMSAAFPASEIMIPPRCDEYEERFKPVGPKLRFHGRDVACSLGGSDQPRKQAIGQPVSPHAFRVPLNPNNPIGIAGPFHALHDAVRSLAGNAQLPSRLRDGLVMGAVHDSFGGTG